MANVRVTADELEPGMVLISGETITSVATNLDADRTLRIETDGWCVAMRVRRDQTEFIHVEDW